MVAILTALHITALSPLQADHASPAQASASHSLVAWSPEGLPRNVEPALDRIPGVRATTVSAGIDWMTRSRSATGKVIDHPPAGYAIPLEMLAIDPKEYSHFIAPADRRKVQGLTAHQVLLARTEAALRGAGKGLRLTVGRTLHATGVISDHSTQGYEGLIPRPVPPSWTTPSRFVLIKAERSVSKARLRRAIESKLSPGQHLRIHSQSQTRYLRYADAVQPPLIIKKNFGEFSARRLSGGGFQLDGAWLTRNLRTESVPILGRFTCNKRLFPQLRGALAEVQAKGLSRTIDPSQFAGCFNPRLIPSQHSTQLSHHAWGIAVDINSRANPFGARPDQDPRLVKIMRKWGLTWGGKWLIPDGMHFEWMRFP
jgi:hypothetical protein